MPGSFPWWCAGTGNIANIHFDKNPLSPLNPDAVFYRSGFDLGKSNDLCVEGSYVNVMAFFLKKSVKVGK